jgi:pantoate--beta-alanine ligase
LRVIKKIEELDLYVKSIYYQTIGLVPTMGFLHLGHMELVRTAKAQSDHVIVSIFVNPTQFGPNEDLSRYPRDLNRDVEMLKREGVDVVFAPEAHEIYPQIQETSVETVKLSKILMGKLRPGHFAGVATICAKLFNITRADKAFFGEKDYQQLLVIRRMVSDLNMPIDIVSVPIMREADGLAYSSRNVLLTPQNRAAAPILNQALDRAAALIENGESSILKIKKIILDTLQLEKSAHVEAIDIRHANDLTPLTKRSINDYQIGVAQGLTHSDYAQKLPIIVLLSVQFGAVRLIDNRLYNLVLCR